MAAGCRPTPRNPTGEPPGSDQPSQTEQPERTAADYFPYKPGMTLVYEGRGNEFASYEVTVLYREDDRLEWRRDTGGTVMAEVFRVEPDEVTLIHREGEAYDHERRLDRETNVTQVLLKSPVETGTRWTSGDAEYRITAVDAEVEALDRTLDGVLVVEARRENSLTRSYYHPAYGLVLSVFESEGGTVESRPKEASRESPRTASTSRSSST